VFYVAVFRFIEMSEVKLNIFLEIELTFTFRSHIPEAVKSVLIKKNSCV